MKLKLTSFIDDLNRSAGNLCCVIKKMPEGDKDLQIKKEFEKSWDKFEVEFSSKSLNEKMSKSKIYYF